MRKRWGSPERSEFVTSDFSKPRSNRKELKCQSMSAQSNITAVKDGVGIVREVAIIVAVARTVGRNGSQGND
jgi:hypothetical protein